MPVLVGLALARATIDGPFPSQKSKILLVPEYPSSLVSPDFLIASPSSHLLLDLGGIQESDCELVKPYPLTGCIPF